MQRRFRHACTAITEHSSAHYTKLAAASGFFRSVDVIVARATSPSNVPLHEKYVHELLKVFAISGQTSLHRFTMSFTRRLNRTMTWRVALKCLLLLHRLLQSPASSPEITALIRSEILWAKSNGLISLHPYRFRDDSSASSDDYTAFVRSYAHFLDEALICTGFMSDRVIIPVGESGKYVSEMGSEKIGFTEKMKEIGRVLELLPQLQSLIDRAMACRPAGKAAKSFVVGSAMKSIVRDSFTCYEAFRRESVVVLDDLFEIPYNSCLKAFGVYKKAGLQAEKLSEFYDWCKEMGFCGFYEYPFVERIPLLQIQALESFLQGMWHFSESEDSSVTESVSPSEGSLTDYDDGDKVNDAKRLFYIEEEEPLLLQFKAGSDDESENWEALLEASIDTSDIEHNFFDTNLSKGIKYWNHVNKDFGDQRDEKHMMMVCHNQNGVNPFDYLLMQGHLQRNSSLNLAGGLL